VRTVYCFYVTHRVILLLDITTTRGSSIRPKARGSPTSSTSINWFWSTTPSSTWAPPVSCVCVCVCVCVCLSHNGMITLENILYYFSVFSPSFLFSSLLSLSLTLDVSRKQRSSERPSHPHRGGEPLPLPPLNTLRSPLPQRGPAQPRRHVQLRGPADGPRLRQRLQRRHLGQL